MTQKTFHLKGLSLKIATEIIIIHRTANEAQLRLQQEFADRAQRRNTQLVADMAPKWRELFYELGLPPEQIGEWVLDARWLEDHAIAVLVKAVNGSEPELQAGDYSLASDMNNVEERKH